VELRKKETTAIAKKSSLKKDELSGDNGSQPASGTDTSGGDGGMNNMSMNETTPEALPGELAKHEAMCKCAGCSRLDKYAKGELSMNKATPAENKEWNDMKRDAGVTGYAAGKGPNPKKPSAANAEWSKMKADATKKSTPAENKEWESMKQDAGVTGYAAGTGPHPKKPSTADKQWSAMKAGATKKSQPNTFVTQKGDGKLPPEKTKEVAAESEGGNDGTDTQKGKSIAKAGMAMGGAMPKPPTAPKLAGAAIPPPHPAMKPMKLPGVSMTPKTPKPPAPAGGAPAMKKELNKAVIPSVRDKVSQAAKLPGVRASVGNTMDSMLAAKPAPMLAHTPAPQLAGVGQPIARPAQGVQTMAERVASKVPAGPSTFNNPPAAMKPKIPGAMPQAAAPSVPSLQSLAAAHTAPKVAPVQTMTERVASKMPPTSSFQVPGEKSHGQLIHEARKSEKSSIKKMEYGLSLSELGPCALCKKAEHSGRCQ
jgi:hypothetical protein